MKTQLIVYRDDKGKIREITIKATQPDGSSIERVITKAIPDEWRLDFITNYINKHPEQARDVILNILKAELAP